MNHAQPLRTTWVRMQLLTNRFVVLLWLLTGACSAPRESTPGARDASSNGGATAAGAANAGAAASMAGGGSASAGSTSAGASATGGSAAGGSLTTSAGGLNGDASVGGAPNGGAAAIGGTSAGGALSGGASTNGGTNAAGGRTTTTSGGTSATSGSGGTNTAGASVGGSSVGGSAGAAARGGSGPVDTNGPPFTVKSGLFDQSKVDDLGLQMAPGAETITIFRPSDASDHYSNGVVLLAFKGWLYAQWQSSATDEDSADTWTAYSRSQDGKSWSLPLKLAVSTADAHRTSGGFWVWGDTLVAYLNVWPTNASPRGGYVQYVTSKDGLQWSTPKAVTMSDGGALNGIFEQDPHALAEGRIINAAHFQPGLMVAPCYTDDPSGTAGWKRAPFKSLAASATSTRELEPSSFVRADGGVVMVFRDQDASYRKLASLSADRGVTWSTPVVSDMPDSRSKQSAGNLPDGSAYFVSNPVTTKTRAPLVVTLSRDGRLFDRAFLLRKGGTDLQAQRYTGTAKTLGYNYPKSMVANGYLYVGYATNKEDVQLTRVPLTSLGN